MDSYQVNVNDEVYKMIRQLPGNVRQRVLRALQALRKEPRPQDSRALDMTTSAITLAAGMEVRRIRIAN